MFRGRWKGLGLFVLGFLFSPSLWSVSLRCQESLVVSSDIFVMALGEKNFGPSVFEPPSLAIETPRLHLGQLPSRDLLKMRAILTEPDVDTFMIEPISAESINKSIHAMQRPWHKEHNYFLFSLAILEKHSKTPIGALWIYFFPEDHSASIGYVVGQKYRQMGYASEAVNGVMRYFNNSYFNFHYYFAVANIENTASVKLLTKHDFVRSKPISPSSDFYYFIREEP